MAVPCSQTDDLVSTSQVPLIYEDQEDEAHLSKSLNHLETILRVFGFCQHSFISITLSWLSFLLLGIALPVVMIHYFSYCTTDCKKYQIRTFEIQVLVFQCLVAAISLVCISHNLRKYGFRKFLFVDRYHGHMAQFRDEYVKKINGFFRLLAVWVLPFLLLKIVREAVRIIYVPHHSWGQSVAILIALIVSWTYSITIYLSGCALFNLVCNFQVIHFENYGKLLERDMDVSQYIEEHIRLTHYLSKISHRFRIFFILELLVVTASQVVALFQTTWNSEIINFINGGDFVISSIVELVGLIICLHAAAKITHRAQGTGSVAAKWHSIVTCASDDTSQVEISGNGGSSEAANTGHLLCINYSESDLEAVDYVPVPTTTQLASYMSTYHKRQAFGYGLTETGGGATRTLGPEETSQHASVGRLSENMEAKIVDPETGEALGPGQRGELWLRGPTVMKGYVGDEKATAETLHPEGWLKTGDLCYFDSDGFLYIVDRLKELIKYKAFQVPPAELEKLLQSNPEIADAAVIPYPDEEAGQIPMAYVVRKPGSNITEAQIMDSIAKQVAPYKKIRRVAFISAIPKSPAGKILRRELVNHALAGASSKL